MTSPGAALVAWDVYAFGGRWLTTVFYTADCDAAYVLRACRDHDGMPAVHVRRRRAP